MSDQKPVQLRPVGEGYEMSLFGAVPIGTPYLDPAQSSPDRIASVVVASEKRSETVTQTPQQAVQPSSVAPTTSRHTKLADPITSPRAVIKAAKARVKQIRAELKNKRALERELAELERLIRASREKPSNVRALKRVG